MRSRGCELDRLPPVLRPLFTPLPPDPYVEAFAARSAPYGPLREAAHRVLRRVVSDFDADGLLGTHPMALLGERSFEALVGHHRGGRLLDVGAGSGDVTVHARPLFREIVTTETSGPMARRLRRRGLPCYRLDLSREALPDVVGRFDVVALLNVLDRCERPRSLLAGAVRALAARGQVLLSVPLPARPHVDVGPHTVDPDEPLGGRGERWEEALADLVESTVRPAGLTPVRIARAPYLSLTREGVVELDAAVILAER